MSSTTPLYYTKEALTKLRNELADLKTKGRARVAQNLEMARSKGDLKENAEYHAAREAQGILEAKIHKLNATIAQARVINPNQLDKSRVSISSKVKLKHMETDTMRTYTLVSPAEADLATGKLSIASPIGKGLLGKKINDIATIHIPAGKTKFQIIDIAY